MREAKPQYRTLREAIISANLQTGATLRHEWVYEDQDNLEAFRVLDYESEDDGRRQVRTVWPVSWDKDGWEEGWCMGMPPGPWPLYRLPELEPFQRVFICQDEREADALRSAGLVATAAAHGCYYLNKTDFAPLAGRDVVLVPKFDEAGPVFVRKVTAILARQLPRAEVRVLELPGLPECGGVWQYLLECHPRSPEVIGAEIDEMADRLPEYWTLRRSWSATTRLLDVEARGVHWLWPERIVMGKLNLLYGYTPLGKSPLGIDLAARVSRGMPWPDRSGTAPRGSVVLLNYQDSLADTICPQLEQAGADLSRVFALHEPPRTPGGRAELTSIATLHRAIDQANLRISSGQGGAAQGDDGVKLVLIDPVTWYLSGNANAALGALSRLAVERNVAVVMVLPMYKPSGALRKYRAMGGPLFAAAQSAWLTVSDGGPDGRQLLLPMNGSDANATGLAFRIVDDRIEWEAEPVNLTAEDLLLAARGSKRRGPPPAARTAAANWLRERLASGPAYVGNPDVEEPGSLRRQAREAGFSWSTLRRAFAAMGAVSERCSVTGRYQWRAAK